MPVCWIDPAKPGSRLSTRDLQLLQPVDSVTKAIARWPAGHRRLRRTVETGAARLPR